MLVAYFDNEVNHELLDEISKNFGECRHFNDPTQFMQIANEFDLFIFGKIDEEQFTSMLIKLKQDNDCFLKPLLTTYSTESQLVDSNLENIEMAKTIVEQILVRNKELDINQFNWRSKVLYYLYSRNKKELIPNKDWHHPSLYSYPIIDVFAAKHDYHLWLNDMVKQKIFNVNKLVDKLFYCPYCLSAHLEFQEICPSCHSFNLEVDDFLHCFTCGLIAPQTDFLQQGQLVCPRCNTQLKHIGDDYDRPLETGSCLDCNNYYMDSDVHVICMICNKEYDTDFLKKTSIYHFEFTEAGMNYAKLNAAEDIVSAFDELNYIKPQFFFKTLDWFIAMQWRYEDEFFSLLGIHFSTTLTKVHNSSVHLFSEKLREIIRKTDFITRLNEKNIWILLPKTNKAAVDVVISRFKQLQENLQTETDLTIEFSVYSSSKDTIEGEKADLLIAKLNSSYE